METIERKEKIRNNVVINVTVWVKYQYCLLLSATRYDTYQK